MSPPYAGAVWNGFEWVSPARYEEMICEGHDLPPLQPVPTDHYDAAGDQGGPVTFGGVLPEEPFGGHGYSMPTPPTDWTTHLATQVTGPHFTFRALEHLTDTMRMLLHNVDPDAARGGLAETPERAAKAWLDWTAGYAQDPAGVLKVFEDGAEGCDEMVVVHNIPVYSHCEHHLAPIFGTATVGYLPNGRIVGLSKLNRLVDIFARRLQVQERLTNQVAAAMMEHLQPHGCGVVVRARHMCMESRGVKQAGTHTTTSAMLGVFRDDARVRAEFLSLAR